MAEEYRFFNHIEGDRQYNAEEFAEYFRQVLTSGILNGGANLQVYCNGTDRYARIKPGVAWIEGYFYKNTAELPLELAPADGTYDRIDRIVLRLDRNPENRYIRAFVKTGTPAMNPVAPELVREGLVYEISLAQILIIHNTSVVAADKVTDERLNASVCGLVNSLIQVDTSEMQAEFDVFMETLEEQSYVPMSVFEAHKSRHSTGGADALSPIDIGAASLGTANTDINKVKALELKTDTRSTVLTYTNSQLTKVEEKDGTTVVKTTNLTYDAGGNITQVQEIAGGTTVTTTLTYTSGTLTSVSKVVS